MSTIKCPAGTTEKQFKVLTTLVRTGECNYSSFREGNNPWRRESYFDGQIKRLVKKDLVILRTKTIMATNSGIELVRSYGNEVQKLPEVKSTGRLK
jgi:DNA-binding MarR family transcriptional regulator